MISCYQNFELNHIGNLKNWKSLNKFLILKKELIKKQYRGE